MTCEVLHAVRVQTNAVAGTETVWVLQILAEKHRRYPVDINTLCRHNGQLFNIRGLVVRKITIVFRHLYFSRHTAFWLSYS